MPTNQKTLAVIPARWASVRFPGKPLTDILGKPMVQWVSEQAKKARLVTEVVIATDDKRIYGRHEFSWSAPRKASVCRGI